MTMYENPPPPRPRARRTRDQRWRLTARIGLASLAPVHVLAIVVMLTQCGLADGCGNPPRELEYLSWTAFSVSATAGLFASFAPQRFHWSQRARPPLTLLQCAAMTTAVGAVLATAP
ncbi:hypothetical protein [Streptomyces albipurpureus]|uniref:Uncharacterized protein n=1 Tax=Streptomyces albipurpureus TaxID=2897419 RepID=A0ABT0V069_9ACTN|nr:hypothetical protein [Streptomyces sp. CWNU-1]MCM2394111.1 hypothetical protein [Streptomyces sp. CWNU-1]